MYSRPLSQNQPLKILMQKTQKGDVQEPQSTQSTYFSQAALSQDFCHSAHGYDDQRKVSPYPRSRWAAEPAPLRPPLGEPSQDSGLSQESAAPAAGLRTKSEALEQRIEHERQQRRQLERDVREAVTVVAAHVQALPERWAQLEPRLLEAVQRAGQQQAEKSDQQLGRHVQRLAERVDAMEAELRRALLDTRSQSDGELLSAVRGMRESVSEMLHHGAGTADRLKRLQQTVEDISAAPVLGAGDRAALEQLTTAAGRVTAAVSDACLVPSRLADELRSQQRQLAAEMLDRLIQQQQQQQQQQQAVRQVVPTPAPLAARSSLTSPVGTVRPQPCPVAAARPQPSPAERRRWHQKTESEGEASPPAKQRRPAEGGSCISGPRSVAPEGSARGQRFAAPEGSIRGGYRSAPPEDSCREGLRTASQAVPPKQAVPAAPRSVTPSVRGAPYTRSQADRRRRPPDDPVPPATREGQRRQEVPRAVSAPRQPRRRNNATRGDDDVHWSGPAEGAAAPRPAARAMEPPPPQRQPQFAGPAEGAMPPPQAAVSRQRAPSAHKPIYSPESDVASLTEITGKQAGIDVYDFMWESEDLCPRRPAAVRTYSRTPSQTPLRTPAARGAHLCSPDAPVRRSVSRPCRLPGFGSADRFRARAV